MSKFFYIVILSMLLINCTSNTIIKKPDNLIPKDEMANLISDLLLASGGQNIKNIQLQRKVNYFPLVYAKYGIDSTQFQESNYYYVSRVDDYDDILKKVKERLDQLKNENQENKKEIKVQDSILKAERDSILKTNKGSVKNRTVDSLKLIKSVETKLK